MKLLKAKFTNFRLLKDLQLDFSSDKEKPLTVIRAANETGKTTCETGLIWALYGSKLALPKKGDFRLFPSDLSASGETKIQIEVEIEFEVEEIRRIGLGSTEIDTARYRLVRSCIEFSKESGSTLRESEVVKMYKLTDSGTVNVESSAEIRRIIENSLPASLKDVYFTDGDSAMSFIEAAVSTGVKRKRVSEAVESLLGLEHLDRTIRHLKTVGDKFSQEIDDTDYKKELEKLNDRINSWTEDIEEGEVERAELEIEHRNGLDKLKRIKVDIEEALKLGDKIALLNEKKLLENNVRRQLQSKEDALKSIAGLLDSKHLSKASIAHVALPAMSYLKELSDHKKLPKVNVPILEELLERSECFCGEDLSAESSEGRGRRLLIEESISGSREADNIQEIATSLFYRVRSENFGNGPEKWFEDYKSTYRQFQNATTTADDLRGRLKRVEDDISSLDDSQINKLKEQESNWQNKLDGVSRRVSQIQTQVDEAKQRKKEGEEDRHKAENRLNKSNTSTTKLTLSRRVTKIFEGIVEKLKIDEVQHVSDEMNRIFLEMIGSSPEDNSLSMITKAELTKDFDILVYGPDNVQLNPDQDLNGASRRAITLAFILAITKVSKVEAPNIIDTPLGMMSGYVKQSVMLQILKEGSQVILFLTHDEIKGVENLIDRYAGIVFTLTNPAHYPRMLEFESPTQDPTILRCECNHRNNCNICKRKDVEVQNV